MRVGFAKGSSQITGEVAYWAKGATTPALDLAVHRCRDLTMRRMAHSDIAAIA
jgi:hypothetical protein